MSGLRYEVPAITEEPSSLEYALRLHEMTNEDLAVTTVEHFSAMDVYAAAEEVQLAAGQDMVAMVQEVAATSLQTLMGVNARIARGQLPTVVSRDAAILITGLYIAREAGSLKLDCFEHTERVCDPTTLEDERVINDVGVVLGIVPLPVVSGLAPGKLLLGRTLRTHEIGAVGSIGQLMSMEGLQDSTTYNEQQIAAIEVLARIAQPRRHLVAREVNHG